MSPYHYVVFTVTIWLQAMAETYEGLLKVITIGDTAVGKTCIILRYTQDLFRENFLSTIGQ